jgi:hypothetical protein
MPTTDMYFAMRVAFRLSLEYLLISFCHLLCLSAYNHAFNSWEVCLRTHGIAIIDRQFPIMLIVPFNRRRLCPFSSILLVYLTAFCRKRYWRKELRFFQLHLSGSTTPIVTH